MRSEESAPSSPGGFLAAASSWRRQQPRVRAASAERGPDHDAGERDEAPIGAGCCRQAVELPSLSEPMPLARSCSAAFLRAVRARRAARPLSRVNLLVSGARRRSGSAFFPLPMARVEHYRFGRCVPSTRACSGSASSAPARRRRRAHRLPRSPRAHHLPRSPRAHRPRRRRRRRPR